MVCLVFGGRSPISMALCTRLVEQDKKVHLVTRIIDDEIIRLGERHGVTQLHECDLADEASTIKLVRELDEGTSGLQGVAFVHRYRGPENPLLQYQVEVLTPFQVIHTLSGLVRSSTCAIAVTTSPAARSTVGDQGFQYHASKAALNSLVRFGAVRYAGMQLRVNGVSPGSFVFKDRAAAYYAKNPQVLELVERSVPLGRMANVEEIASVIAFLLEDASDYVNGQIIEVDGGLECFDGASLARRLIGK